MHRPDDLESKHARHPRQPVGAQGLEQIVRLSECLGDVGETDRVRTCGQMELDAVEALADHLDGIRLLLVDALQVLLATGLGRVHLCPINGHDQLLLAVEPRDVAAAEACALIDVEGVVAIGRKEMLDEQAAAGTQGQPLDVLLLVGSRVAANLDARSCSRSVADGSHGDVMGRVDVLVEERGRHAQ